MGAELPRAILFDLDDTLLDYSGCVDECWEAVCEEVAAELRGGSPAELRREIRLEGRWYWSDPGRAQRGRLAMETAFAEIVAGALERLKLAAPGIPARMAASFMTRQTNGLRLFPDSIATLEALRGAGVHLGLVTNGHPLQQRPKIERFALAGYFDCIAIEGEFGAGKPDGRIFRHVLQAVGASPEEAWMVGDNLEWDVVGAQHVGILGVWRDVAGLGLPESAVARPDRIIRQVGELLGN